MKPCTCPSCGEELLVTCPNRCANAADGATAESWAPASAAGPVRRRASGGTRAACLGAVSETPQTATEIARHIGEDTIRGRARVGAMLSLLINAALIDRVGEQHATVMRWRYVRKVVAGRA